MCEENTFEDMVIGDAKARIAFLESATSQEVREWKLTTALQKLASDRKECPRDLHGWTSTRGSAECSSCEEARLVKAYSMSSCWQEWALQQVEGYISDSYEIIDKYDG